jgi:betaine-aldehyde dehydrogenase
VDPAGTERLVVVSPATEEPVGSVPAAVPADIDAAVTAAREAFDHGPWPQMTQAERAAKMRDLAAAMRHRVEETATAITSEMGSVISYTRAGQAPAPIDMLEYYAAMAGTVGQPEDRVGAYASWTITKEPVGVVGAIVPWNGPIFLAMFKIAPALLAGCTIVLKPSPESPLSAYLLAEAVEAAGLPAGVLNIVPGDREVGRHLVRHRGLDKIAFTGSTQAATFQVVC